MNKNKFRTLDLVYMAVCAALICVCTWISIPAVVPFTMQTFAVFAALELLGAKRGSVSVLLYILLGAVGLPVFSNFRGGLGVLFGMTGGYIVGFVFICLVYAAALKLLGSGRWVRIAALVLGLFVCYAFGTIWFINVYTAKSGPISIGTALSMCVFPFIIPDCIKLFLAMLVSGRVKKYLR